MPRRILFWISLLFSFLPRAAAAGDDSPVWPLGLPTRYLTSNFMEYRDGRFHAGIDLKTRSQSGYPVRAVEDGYLVRVRTSPGAYGRAVYLKGNSGRTYVFAHLMRFNDALRTRVRQAQEKEDRFAVQVHFSPEQWPVKAGDVLGLSGQSGTSGPHLHFEVRDSRGRPIDPQAAGFAVADTIAPLITGLTAWPAAPEVRINGKQVEHHLSGGDTGLQGQLPTLVADGPVAFSARILEQTDIKGHKLEPWRIEVLLDGDPVFRCRNEAYDFSENSLQRLEWADWVDLENGEFRERWLHRRPGNTLEGREGGLWYLGPEGSGLNKGSHDLVIRAWDRAGNGTEARLILVIGENQAAGARDWQPRPLGLPEHQGFRMTPFFQVGDAAALGLQLQRFSPESGDPVLGPLNLVIKDFVLDPADPTLEWMALEKVGPAAMFLAVDWIIEAPLPVTFPESAHRFAELVADPSVGVYRQKEKGEWTLVGAPVLRDVKSLGFRLDEPGIFAVLRDTIPPLMSLSGSRVKPGPRSPDPAVTMPRWAVIEADLLDNASGVAPESIEVTLAGQKLIAEPDLIRDRILIELPDELAPGNHVLEIRARDEAGNAMYHQLHVLLVEEEE